MYSLNKTLFLFQLNENKIQAATTRRERRRVVDQQRNVEASRESIKTTVRVIVDFVVQVTLKNINLHQLLYSGELRGYFYNLSLLKATLISLIIIMIHTQINETQSSWNL